MAIERSWVPLTETIWIPMKKSVISLEKMYTG